jgi:hypothetical protein
MESSPLDIWKHLLLAANLKAAQKENPSQPLTQAVWKKKKKNLVTNKITKQNRQEIKKYE